MHTTIDNVSQFRDAFHRAGRGDQFSYEALGLLFDYFEECAPDMELDVIAICCEYSEGDDESIADDYSIDLSECEDDEEKHEAVREYLEHNTSIVGEISGGFVYAQF
jgi:hypothetical protein